MNGRATYKIGKCPRCDFDKPIKVWGGIHLCLDCREKSHKEYMRKYLKEYGPKYFADNRKKINKKLRKWRNNNPEKVQAQRKRQLTRHGDTKRARWREWYWSNRDSILKKAKTPTARKEKRERERRYREKYPEKAAVLIHRRLARLKNIGGEWKSNQWNALVSHYASDSKCLSCGKKRKLSVDHVSPICKGGRNEIQNLQPLCGSCNSSKGRSTIDFRPDGGAFARTL